MSKTNELPGHVPATRKLISWVVLLVVLVSTVIALRIEGRRWWCECGQVRIWINQVFSSHCSQHLFDPYSLTHLSHGLIFFALLAWLSPRLSLRWRFCIAVSIAAGWEVLENSPLIINRYRTATMSYDYLGDSVVNSLGDILSCAIGFAMARWLRFWGSLALFIILEVVLLFMIRDNLTLNIIMLIKPVEAIKTWQAAGQP